ncbi:MAG: hypothetical protein HYY62_05385 [Deltaproteobacteria bacterium]|nr:hypothetical protein [Deltaproteobacteria bacterium]
MNKPYHLFFLFFSIILCEFLRAGSLEAADQGQRIRCEDFLSPFMIVELGQGLGIVAKTRRQLEAIERSERFLETGEGQLALKAFMLDPTRQGFIASHLASGGSAQSAYIAASSGQTSWQVVVSQRDSSQIVGGYTWQHLDGIQRQASGVLTRRLRDPRAVSTTRVERVGAGRFIPLSDELIENANLALRKAREGFKQVRRGLLATGQRPSREEWHRMYVERYHYEFSKLTGLKQAPVILDTPALNIRPSRSTSIIFDHHGPFFDPRRPKRNTTMQVLDYIEKVMAGSGSPTDKIAFLKRTFRFVTTDNLADGGWSIWIAQNLEKVISDKAFRNLIRLATEYEDFGVFATEFQQRAVQAFEQGDFSLKQAMDLQQAILRGYDEILTKYGVKYSDRFHLLPKREQQKLMQDALNIISMCLESPTFLKGKIEAFLYYQTGAIRAVEAGHLSMREILLQDGLGEDFLNRFEGVVYYFNGNAIDASKYGTIVCWSAPAQAHNQAIQLNMSPKPDGKVIYILANPEGRPMPIPSLMDIGREIQALHLKRSFEKGEMTEPQFTEALRILQSQGIGRDALQFSFQGVYLTPREIVEIVDRGLQK